MVSSLKPSSLLMVNRLGEDCIHSQISQGVSDGLAQRRLHDHQIKLCDHACP